MGGFDVFKGSTHKICGWSEFLRSLEVIKIVRAERCEYSSIVELDHISGNYFIIPSSIILKNEINDKFITTFSFLSIRRGLDYKIIFLINDIVKWMRKQPDRHKNGINNKILKSIECLEDMEYLNKLDVINSSHVEASFNISKLSQDCEHERFAIIYLDELERILNYQSENSKDSYINNDIVLLVFSYLRMKIYRRKNKLMIDEINYENKNSHEYDIAARRQRAPEAYDCYYSDIAEELDLSSRVVSKAVEILNNLELIYSESLPRIRYLDGETERWRTDHTLFCNAYKREGNCLLASGKDYYLVEIENKKKKLNIK